MKKCFSLLLLSLFFMSCEKEEVVPENLNSLNLTANQNLNYTLNTTGGTSTGATFGVKFFSGDLQLATGTPFNHPVTFEFNWYRIQGSTRHQVIPVVFSMTLPANSTFVEHDMSNADFLLNMECSGNSYYDINAMYEVEISNAFSMGDFSFEDITIQNNNMNYNVTYGCGQWGAF